MEDSKDAILKQEMPLSFTRVEESSILLVGATQIFKNDPTSVEGRKKLLDGARGKELYLLMNTFIYLLYMLDISVKRMGH